MKKILLLIAFSLTLFCAYAQLDSVHYLPPLKQTSGTNNSANHNSSAAIQQQSIYLSTPETTAFSVNVYRGTSTTPWLTIPSLVKGTPFIIDNVNDSGGGFTDQVLANSNNNITLVNNGNTGSVLTTAGLRFESPGGQKFYVNYRGRSSAQAGSLTCKGSKALGKEFRWGGIPNRHNNANSNTSLGIMATQPNTTVTISGFNPDCAFRDGTDPDGITNDVIVIPNMQPGETFVLEAVRNQGGINATINAANIDGWLGAKIEATEPIAIACGGLNFGLNPNSQGRDVGIDQPVPTSVIGREYVFMRGNGDANDGTEFPVIVATRDETDVFAGNTFIGSIDDGEFLEIPGSNYSGTTPGSNMYVRTTKDAYAYQCLAGQVNKIQTVGMNFIAPVNCLLPSTLEEIPQIQDIANANSNISALTIVASTLIDDMDIEIYQNNVQITTPTPKLVNDGTGSPQWKTFYVPGLTGEISVITPGPIAVGTFMSLGDNAGLAGYFSGFDTVPVVEVQLTGGGCHPGSSLEEVTGGFANYAWYKGFDEISGTLLANGPGLQTYDPILNGVGNYFVRVTDFGGCEYNSAVINFFSCDPEVQVTKVDNADPIDAGSNVTFTITAESFSVDPITNVTINDVLPAELDFVSATPEPGTTFSSSGSLTWNIGGMNPGDKFELEIVARARDNASGTVTNTISYNYTEIGSEINNLPDDLEEDVTITPCNLASAPSSTPEVCINSALTDITHTTTIATGIANDGVSGANGLPAGVSATWNADTITISGTPTATGIFNYSILLTGGCNTVNATGTITVNALPVANAITGPTEVCQSSTISLTEGTTGTIIWDSSNTGIATIDGSGQVTGVSAGTTDITYTVTDGNGCTSPSSATYTITVNPLPVLNTLTTNSAICAGEDAEFYISGSPMAVLTYNLNGNPNETVTLDGSGNATIVETAATSNSTINLVSLEFNTTGCVTNLSNTVTVTVNPNPTLATATNIIECLPPPPAPTQTLNANDAITLNPNTTIQWFDAASGGNVVTTPTLNTVGAISYFAEITDTSTLCINPIREEILLEIVSPPFPNLTEENCSNESLNIGIGSFATTYTVATSNPAVSPGPNRTTATAANITDTYVNNTGTTVDITYTVTISDGSACDGSVFSVIATIYPESNGGNISADQKICSGASPADISVTGITGNIEKWQQSTSPSFSSFTDIAETSTTLTATTTGVLTQTTYYRAVIKNNVCNSVNSPIVTINVDTTAPVITGSLPATTIEGCEASDAPVAVTSAAALETLGLTINDNFSLDANLIVSHSDISNTGTCPNNLIITRTYTIADECNNSTDIAQTITIEDTTAPTWTTAANNLDRTVECSNTAGITAAQALFPVASDLCDTDVTNITKTSGAFVASSTCTQAGTYTNTWTVTDDCGNTSAVYTQTITIEDNAAPTWTTPENDLDRTLECSDAISGLTAAQALFPIASDLCDGDVTNIVKTTGTFIASSTCSQSGTYTNTWTVTDDCGNVSDTFTQIITIEDTVAPTWITTANNLDRTVECSDTAGLTAAQALSPVANDMCDDDVSNIIKTSGTFVASGTCTQAGTYTNTWTVTDDCGNVSATYTQTITIEDTTAPTWTTATNDLDRTVECSDTTSITVAQALFPIASDLCDTDVTNITKTSGAFVVSGTCAQAGTYTNTWTVTDDCGNVSATYTQTITIEDTTAPTWTTAANDLDRTIECSDTAGLTTAQALFPIASDLCDTDVTNITKTSGAFVASGTCTQAGTYTNTWAVTDDCGNVSATYTQTITIEDTTAPTWTTAANDLDRTIECSDTAGLTTAQALFPIASDLCDTDVTNITKTSGAFVASGTCTQAGTYTNTWAVTDDCGNVSDTFTQTITIEDTTAPTWTTIANDLDRTVECSDTDGLTAAQALFPVASDLCDTDVTNITKTSGAFVASSTCTQAGTYTNTWTVTDDCGNVSDTFTQTITIEDTTSPTWTTAANDLDRTVECSDTTSITVAQALFPIASDLCDTDVTNITKTSGAFVVSGTCAQAGTYTNTWTVTDDCGNVSATYTQTITIEDTTAPTWTTAANDLDRTVECSDTAGLTAAQALFPVASDLCDTDVTNITKTSGAFVASSTCTEAGTYTNTWTVTDDCGNVSATYTQTITIEDTTAPTWTTIANDLDRTVECSDTDGLTAAQALFPVASDLCDTDVTNITKTSGAFVASSTCTQAGTYTNTWTVTDDCGNVSDTFTQTITIEDTTSPTWTTAANDLDRTVECSDTTSITVAQALFPIASDLCDTDVTNITKTSGAFVVSGTCAQAGTYTNTWTVTDDCGNVSATYTQTITIEDTTAPTWTTAANDLDRTVECSDTAGLTAAQALFPVASDLCDTDVTNITKTSGAFVASSTCTEAGTYTNTWTVTDDCGNVSATYTQTITIEDTTAPTWTTIANDLDRTVECSDTAGLTAAQALFPVASDLCDTDVTNITKTSGAFVASSTCTQTGTYTNTWTVTDDCGNISGVYTQTITIQDTTPPTGTAPDDITGLECIADIPVADVNIITDEADVCGGTVMVTVADTNNGATGCNGSPYIVTRTYTLTDCVGLQTDVVQTITVEINSALVLPPDDGSIVNSIVDAVQPAAPVVTDVCGNNIVPVITENVDPLCDGQKIYTFAYTDCGGNTSVYTYTYTIDVTATLEIVDTTATGCSDVALNYNLTTLTALPGVSFDWEITPNSNITGAANGSGIAITDVITNVSGVPQDILYTITPYNQNGCAGNTFDVLVTVNPEPFVASLPTDTTCSNVALNHNLNTDVDLNNVTFSWFASNNANVNGETTTPSTANTISDILINTSGIIQTVTYTITPTSDNGCEGDAYEYTVTVNPQAELVVSKSLLPAADGNYDTLGEVIQYEITVENINEVAINNVSISDNNADIGSITPIAITTIPAFGTVTFNASHTITQTDLDAGQVINSAIASGIDPCGTSVSDVSDDPSTTDANDSTIAPIIQNPSIALGKMVTFNDENGDGFPQEGETLTYNFTVSNTGNITLVNVSVDDPLITVNGGPISLAPNTVDTTTFFGTHTLTQGNIDSGSITNSATVLADTPNGDPVTDTSDDPDNSTDNDINGDGDPDDATVFNLAEAPELTIYKTGVFIDTNGDGIAQVGETIVYSFDITNTGNITLFSISVTDALVTVSGSPIDLAPNETDSTTFTAVYTLTQDDINNGSVSNTATASGISPIGTPVNDNSDDPTTVAENDATTTTLAQEAQLSLLKTAQINDENANGFPDEGETITYRFDVRNTGNVTISGITITDPLVSVNGGPIDLDPNESDNTTFTATYAITLANINSGRIINMATANGQDPSGNTVSDTSDDPNNPTNIDTDGNGDPDDATETILTANPQIQVSKTGVFNDENNDGLTQVGETISYTFNVINTGNVTISNIIITDPLVSVSGGPIDLNPTESDSITFTATYTIDQTDIDSGSITNSAIVSGEAPNGDLVTDTSDDPNNPTNNDNNGDGDPDDTTITNLPVEGNISLTKVALPAADGAYDTLGEQITYELVVTNTGNVTLTNVAITDANADNGSIMPASIASIAPQTSVIVTATHSINQDELNLGLVTNTASVAGTDPFGNTVIDDSDDPNDPTNNDTNGDGEPDDITNTIITQIPSMSLVKVAVFNDENSDGLHQEGETITYNFTITNTGNVTLSNITVTDPLVTVNGNPINLNPEESDNDTFYAVYTITLADLDSGSITNSATANGEDTNGSNVTDTSDDPNDPIDNDTNGDGDPDDITVTPLPSNPELTLFKTGTFIDANGDGLAQVGETIQYIFDVSNTGNVTISNITVTDPLVTVSGGPISLAPGERNSTVFTAIYTLTLDDVNTGTVINMASTSGTDPFGAIISDNSDDPTTTEDNDPTTTSLAREPELSLFKIGEFNDENGDGIPQAGETIAYTFDIRNTGNVTIFGVTITDPIVPVIGAPIDLNPGTIDNTTFTALYTIQQADIDSGNLTNTALAVGEDNDGGIITDVSDFSDDPDNPINQDIDGDGDPDDPTVTQLTGNPELSLNKTGVFNDTNGNGIANVGETITYTFEVINSGNITATNITISDPLTSVNGGPIDLIPGQIDSTTFTAVYTLSQFDLDMGSVTNIATVIGQDPNGNTIVDASDDPNNPTNVDNNNDGNPDDATVTTLSTEGSISVLKEALDAPDGNYDSVGEQIKYSILITNTGNITLSNIVIADANADAGSITPANITILLPGESTIVTATHTITQFDIDEGSVSNVAIVTATDTFGNTISDASDDPNNTTDTDTNGDGDPDDITITGINQNPSIALTKTADIAPDGLWDTVGEMITYKLMATNTGNVTLSNINVSDTNADPGSISPSNIMFLAPEETVTLVAGHTITQDDLDTGSVTNTAIVSAEDTNGGIVSDISDDPDNTIDNDSNGDGDPDDVTVTTTPQTAILNVEKVVDISSYTNIGDVLTYTITVTNNGNITLLNINVIDANATLTSTPSIASLAPGETFVVTAQHIVTAADIDNGAVANTAIASATIINSTTTIVEDSDDPNNTTNIDNDGDGDFEDPTVSTFTGISDLSITKSVDNSRPTVNSEVMFVITLANEGSVTANTVVIEELIPSGYKYISHVATSGTYSELEGEWIVPQLNENDVYTLEIALEVLGFGDYLNTATITNIEGGMDMNTSNNSDSAAVMPQCQEIYNEFSPNGDGINDFFTISCIENFPNNSLKVYNRWGNIVYETRGYNNDWDGTSNGRVTINESDKLPVGTYYYILDYGDGSKERTGWIYINR